MIRKHSIHIKNEHPTERRDDQQGSLASVWLLVDDRPGNATQGIGLATLLNWPYELKTLRFNVLSRLPNPMLGRSRLSLNQRQSALLAPPWPEFVIAAGRRLAPIARWIKMRSGNRTKVIQIGRKGGSDTHGLDLVISCGHYRLLQDARRLEIFMPLTRVTRERLMEAADGWRRRFNTLARPHVALLVGGPTPVHLFDEEIAYRLAKDVGAAVAQAGGSLTVVTSRRTPRPAIDAMQAASAPGVEFFIWTPNQRRNPYLALLSLADILVVTGESESMLAEAVEAAKPLYIYPLPEQPLGRFRRAKEAVVELASKPGGGVTGRVGKYLIRHGWMWPKRDFSHFHRNLIDAGLARPFGTLCPFAPSSRRVERQEIVRRVHALLSEANS